MKDDKDKLASRRKILSRAGVVGAASLLLAKSSDAKAWTSPDGSVVIGSGGTWQPGSIYSDANWGMIFRARQAAPLSQYQFAWFKADDGGNFLMTLEGSPSSAPFGSSAARLTTGGFRSITSSNRGLDIQQAVPANVEQSTYFNRIDVRETVNSYVINPTVFLNAFSIYHRMGGTSNSAGRNSLEVTLDKTVATLSDAATGFNPADINRNYCAAAFTAQASAGDSGTAPVLGSAKGAVFAMNPVAKLLAGAWNYLGVHCQENNITCQSDSSVWYKAGITVVPNSDDARQGTTYDGAISLSASAGAVGWKNGILFCDANGAQPLNQNNGSLIKTMGPALAVDGIDISSYTFSGSVFKSQNFDINANGQVEMGKVGASNTPYIDFHSGPGQQIAYDSRIIASGGNGNTGAGTLQMSAGSLELNAGAVKILIGGALKTVEVGPPDSGGPGYRMLRVAN